MGVDMDMDMSTYRFGYEYGYGCGYGYGYEYSTWVESYGFHRFSETSNRTGVESCGFAKVLEASWGSRTATRI